jgi:hypothetical protein
MKLKIALIACLGLAPNVSASIVTAQAGVRAARIAMGSEEVRMESSGGGQPVRVVFPLMEAEEVRVESSGGGQPAPLVIPFGDEWLYVYGGFPNPSQKTSSATEKDLRTQEAAGRFLMGWPSSSSPLHIPPASLTNAAILEAAGYFLMRRPSSSLAPHIPPTSLNDGNTEEAKVIFSQN